MEGAQGGGGVEVLEEETVAPGDELSLMIGGNEVSWSYSTGDTERDVVGTV